MTAQANKVGAKIVNGVDVAGLVVLTDEVEPDASWRVRRTSTTCLGRWLSNPSCSSSDGGNISGRLLRDPTDREAERRRGDDRLLERSDRKEPITAPNFLSSGKRNAVMKGSTDTQDEIKSSWLERELDEERFLEQFAALEESLAVLQTHMRGMSEEVKLFGSLARRIRRSACPTALSSRQACDARPETGTVR